MGQYKSQSIFQSNYFSINIRNKEMERNYNLKREGPCIIRKSFLDHMDDVKLNLRGRTSVPSSMLEPVFPVYANMSSSNLPLELQLPVIEQEKPKSLRIPRYRRHIDRGWEHEQIPQKIQKTEKGMKLEGHFQEIEKKVQKENTMRENRVANLESDLDVIKKRRRAERRIRVMETYRNQTKTKVDEKQKENDQRIQKDIPTNKKEINQQPSQSKIYVGDQIASFPKKRVRNKYQECPICLCSISIGLIQQFSLNCFHIYCQDCLKEYARSQIKQYKQIECPNQGCPEILDENSETVRSLSVREREMYYKIMIFHQSTKQGNRLCPNSDCEGFVVMNKEPACCVVCGTQYCPKCMMDQHRGKCDDNEADILESKFNFRRCDQCKFMVEKAKGCNHMTCRCGYQFCYICSSKWAVEHKCVPKPKKIMKKVTTSIPEKRISNMNISHRQRQRSQALAAQRQRQICITLWVITYILLFMYIDIIVSVCLFLLMLLGPIILLIKTLFYSLWVKSGDFMNELELQPHVKVLFYMFVIPVIGMTFLMECRQNYGQVDVLFDQTLPIMRALERTYQ